MSIADMKKTKKELASELDRLRLKVKRLEGKTRLSSRTGRSYKDADIADRFGKYINLADVMMLELDEKGKISFINTKGSRILGYKKSEILGKDWIDTCIPEKNRTEVRTVFRSIMKGDMKPFTHFENPVVTKKGEERLISWHNTYIKGKNGAIISTLSSGTDITDDRAAQEQIQQNEENLRITLESIGDAVISTDTKGRIVNMNPVACRLTGWSLKQAKGKTLMSVFTIVNALTGKKTIAPVARVLKTGKIVGLANHTKLIAKDGREFQIADSAAPIRDSKGIISGVVLVFRDVTERYETEQYLEENRRLLSQTQKLSKLGGWKWDVKEKRAVWSEEVYRIYGVDKTFNTSDLDRILSFYDKEYRGKLADAFSKCLTKGIPYDLDVRFTNAKGERLWCRTIGKAVREHGRIVRIQGTFQDITERKSIEDKLKQSEALKTEITETSPVGITVVEKNGSLSFANTRAEEILGLKKTDIEKRTYNAPEWNIIGIEGGAFPEEELPFARVMKNGKPVFDVRHGIQWPNGKKVFLSINGSPIRDGDGKLLGMVAAFEDISERIESESALYASERKFKNIFNEAFQFALILDSSGKILEMNQLCYSVCGELAVKSEDLQFEDALWWLDNESSRKKTRKAIQELKKGNTWTDEIYFLDKNADIHLGKRIFSPINDSNGNLKHISVVGLDITEQAKDELRISENEARFRTIVESFPDGVFLVDEQGKFKEVNPAACEQVGYSRDELLSIGLKEIVSPKYVGRARKRVSEFNTTPGYMESIHVRKDGTSFPVEVAVIPIVIEGISFKLAISRDISERRKTENQLMDEQLYISSIFRSAPVGIGVIKDRKFQSVNARFCEIVGYSEKELIGKSSRMVYPSKKEFQKVGREKYRQISEKGTGTIETQFKCKDGKTVEVILSSTPMNPDDLSLGVTFTALDITDRKKAERAVQISEERYRQLYETAPTGIAIADVKGSVFSVNDALLSFMDCERGDIEGKHFTKLPFVKRTQILQYTKMLASITRGRTPKPFENSFTRPDGSTVCAELHVNLFTNADGEKMVQAIVVDITERRNMENRISEQEQNFRAVSENAYDAIIVSDSEGNILFSNTRVTDLTGYSENELKKRNIAGFVAPAFRKMAFKRLKQRIKGKKVVPQYEMEILHKTEGNIPVELSASKTVWLNKPADIIVLRDISERKRHEAQLKQNAYYLEKAQEIGKIGTWELDIRKNELIWTKQNYLNFGLKPGTPLTYETFLGQVHPEDRNYVNREWKKGMKTGNYEIEHRLLIGSEVRWVREKADIKYNEKGKPVNAIGFTQDITVQKSAEYEIQNSESKYRSLFENMLNGFALHEIITDKKGKPVDYRYIEVNRAFEKMTGLRGEMAVGRTVTELLPGIENDSVDWIGKYGNVALKGKEERFEQFSETLGRWFSIHAFSPMKGKFATIFEDITERKKSELALEDSEERLNTAQAVASIGDWYWDLETGEAEWSPELCRIAGREPADGSPAIDTWLDHIAEADRAPLQKTIETAISNKKGYETQYRMIRYDNGKTIWLNSIGKIKKGINGEVAGLYGTAQDITAQKEAEEALLKSEQFNAALFEFNPLEIIVVDTKGIITRINQARRNRKGRKPKVGDRMYVDYASEHKSLFKRKLLSCINKKQQQKFEGIEYKGRHLTITMTPFPFGAIIISEDVTEQKEAEQALQESVERFETLTRLAPVGIYETDSKGDCVYTNPTWLEMAGMTMKEAEGKGWMKGINPDDRKWVSDKWYKSVNSDGHWSYEYRFVNQKTGRDTWVSGRATAIKDGFGTVTGYMGVNSDINELVHSENTLRESEERYRGLFEQSNDAVIIHDTYGNVLDVNNKAPEILGCGSEDLMMYSWFSLLPGSVRNDMQKFYNRVKDQGSGLTEVGAGLEGEKELWLEISANILKPYKGIIQSVIRDISERKIFEKKIVAERDNLNGILDSMSDEIYMIDENYQVRYTNKAASAKRGDGVGRKCYSYIFNKRKTCEWCPNDRVSNGESCEWAYKHPDGTDYEMISALATAPDGSRCVLHVAHNSTERKRMERISEAQKEFWQDIGMAAGTEETLNICLSRAIDISLMDSGGIYFLNDRTGDAELVYSMGFGAEFEELVKQYKSDSPNVQMLKAGKPVYADFGNLAVPHRPGILKEGLKAVAVIPVHFEGKVIGSVNIASHIISEISEHSKIALENITTQIGSILARLRINKALQESLQTSADIVASNPSGIFIYQYEEPDKLILLDGNAEAEKLTGICVDKQRGKEFNEIWPKGKKTGTTAEYLDAYYSDKVFESEDLYYDDKNLSGAFRIKAFRIIGNRLVVAFDNITEMKQAEQKLKRSEAELSAIHDNAPIMMILLDEERNVVKVNRAVEENVGRKSKRIIGRRGGEALKCIHVADDPKGCGFGPECSTCRVRNVVLETFKKKSPFYRVEANMKLRRNRKTVEAWVLASTSFLHIDKRKLVLLCLEDITDRKNAEIELREREEHLRAIYEGADNVAFIDTDLNGLKTRITDFSPGAEKMLGYRKNEIIGKKISLIHKFKGDIEAKGITQKLKKGEHTQGLTLFQHKNGNKVSCILSLHPKYNGEGTLIGGFGVALDISKLRETQTALEESEKKLQNIYNEMNEGLCLHKVIYRKGKSVNYRITDVNPAFEQLTQLKRRDVVGKLATQVYGVKKAPFLKEYAAVAEHGKPYSFEVFWPPMNKHFSISVFSPGNGEFATVFTDITQSKLAEEALKESEKRFRSLIESSDEHIFILSPDGEFILSNGKTDHLNCKDVVGRKLKDVFEGHVLDIYKKKLDYVKDRIEPITFQHNLESKEKEAHHMDTLYPIEIDGELWGIGGICRDITDFVRAREALKESETRYLSLFWDAPIALSEQDFSAVRKRMQHLKNKHGNNLEQYLYDHPETVLKLIQDIKIVEINNAMLRKFYSNENGHTFQNMISVESGNAIHEYANMFLSLQKGEISFDCELELQDNRGQSINALVKAFLAPGYADSWDKVFVTYTDITELRDREREAQLHQEQLIHADRMVALGTLVSGVAHEINNPNNSIMLNLSMLKDFWDQALPVLDSYYNENGDFVLGGIPYSETRTILPELLRDAGKSAERIRNIVTDLKNYARADSGHITGKVNIRDVVNSALGLTSNMIKKSTTSFYSSIPEQVPVVIGNGQRLEQVIVNLIENACQALTSDDQSIEVRIEPDNTEGTVSVIIKDQGIGMDSQTAERCSDPFFTTKRDRGGTGLGLSVSSGIVNDHNGTLEFESEPGRGTTAMLRLPAVFEEKK